MATPKKKTIGFCAEISLEIGRRWIDGILQYLDETPELALRDYCFINPFEMDELAAPPPWKSQSDGVLVAFGLGEGDTPEEVMKWLERGQVPAVSMIWEWRHDHLPVVTTDRDAVMLMAADYLWGLGVKQLAFVYDTQDLIDTKVAQPNSSTFIRRVAELGAEASDCVISIRPEGTTQDLNKITGEKHLIELLQDAQKPLGLFCITDLHARAVCSLCERLGLEVPQDVTILGCGDFSIARRHSPTLSTVRTSPEVVGYEAAKLLHHIMNGGVSPSKPLLFGPQEIVERESTREISDQVDDFRRAFEFIQRHACDGITVTEVVSHLAISRRRLEQEFAKRRGHSPGQEIQDVRLAKAKRLLSETTLSIMRVAELTGFNEHSRFTTFFRNKIGVTPSAYRDQH